MNFRNALIAFVFFLSGIYSSGAQIASIISAADFKPLIGSWQGTLTYLDYTSKKLYTMPANMDIEQIAGGNDFLFKHIYPDEPKANLVDTFSISKNGTVLDESPVISKKILDNGNTQIITEILGIDGNDKKPALIKRTYTFGGDVFTIRKDVRFVGQTEYINRHEYSYKIKKS